MPRKIKRYGWIPDLPDQRDFMYAAPLAALRALPPKKDLSGECPPVYDQGELGSCTANAIGGAHEFEQRKQNAKKAFTPSRLFIYYNERAIEGTVNEDSGAMIRDGIKSVVSAPADPPVAESKACALKPLRQAQGRPLGRMSLRGSRRNLPRPVIRRR